MVTLGRVALDGTKLKANASKHKAMSYGRMPEREAALAAEVAAILAEAEATDAAEDAEFGDARGDELPPGLRTRAGRLAKIREAKAALEAEAKARTGNPDAVPDPEAQRNFTDPESRMMRSRARWLGPGLQRRGGRGRDRTRSSSPPALTTDATRHALAARSRRAGQRPTPGVRPRRMLADAGYQLRRQPRRISSRRRHRWLCRAHARPSLPRHHPRLLGVASRPGSRAAPDACPAS